MGRDVSHRVQEAVRRSFEPGSVEVVVSRLAGLELPFERGGIETEAGRERVQAAVALVAAGDYYEFERAAAMVSEVQRRR